MEFKTIHIQLKAEDKELLDQAALSWLKRNKPAGSKADAWRLWLMEGAREEEKFDKSKKRVK